MAGLLDYLTELIEQQEARTTTFELDKEIDLQAYQYGPQLQVVGLNFLTYQIETLINLN
jgi:hypothetical protein